MSRETTLRSSLIRLANSNPELRPHLLPLLKEAAPPGYREVKVPVYFEVTVEMEVEATVDEEGRVGRVVNPSIQEITAYVARNLGAVGRLVQPQMSDVQRAYDRLARQSR